MIFFASIIFIDGIGAGVGGVNLRIGIEMKCVNLLLMNEY